MSDNCRYEDLLIDDLSLEDASDFIKRQFFAMSDLRPSPVHKQSSQEIFSPSRNESSNLFSNLSMDDDDDDDITIEELSRMATVIEELHEIKYQNQLKDVVDQANVPVPPPPQILQLRLLLNIFIGYFLLFRGSTRSFAFIIGAFLYYLKESGIMTRWIKGYIDRRNQRIQQSAGTTNNTNGMPLNGDGPQNDYVEQFYQLTQAGVRIPTSPGLLLDITALIFAFFGSLFPTWQPAAPIQQVPIPILNPGILEPQED